MQSYNKLTLSAEILVEAWKAYEESDAPSSYVKSILLSGAVINILHPYLEENNVTPTQSEFADLVNTLSVKETGYVVPIAHSLQFSRFIYNSLKHAGGRRGTPKPSQDLSFDADLELEAFSLLRDGIGDLTKLVDHNLMPVSQLSDEALDLLQVLPVSKRHRPK